jgi:hypothetical protein
MQSWPSSKYYSGICLDGLRKLWTASFRAEIRTPYLPNTKQTAVNSIARLGSLNGDLVLYADSPTLFLKMGKLTGYHHPWMDTRLYSNRRERLKLMSSNRHACSQNWSLFILSSLTWRTSAIFGTVCIMLWIVVLFCFDAFEGLLTAWNTRSDSQTARYTRPCGSSLWRRYPVYITGTLIPTYKILLMSSELRLKRNLKMHVLFYVRVCCIRKLNKMNVWSGIRVYLSVRVYCHWNYWIDFD